MLINPTFHCLMVMQGECPGKCCKLLSYLNGCDDIFVMCLSMFSSTGEVGDFDSL